MDVARHLHNINLQRKCPKPSLSEAEAKQIFGNEEDFLHASQLRLERKNPQHKTPSHPAL